MTNDAVIGWTASSATAPYCGDAVAAQTISALLDEIGPSILLVHSAGGGSSFRVPELNPDNVAGIIAFEAAGSNPLQGGFGGNPPAIASWTTEPALPANFSPVERNGCSMQGDRPVRLVNYTDLPITLVATEHGTSNLPAIECAAAVWSQAGADASYVYLPAIDLGGGHFAMAQLDNGDYAEAFIDIASEIERKHQPLTGESHECSAGRNIGLAPPWRHRRDRAADYCLRNARREQGADGIAYELLATGRLIVHVGINDQGPFRFAIDTAATGSFVTAHVLGALSLEPIPEVTAFVYGAVARGEPVVDVDRLQIGDIVWSQARLIALTTDTNATASIDGVLGADFLGRYTLELTTGNRLLRLHEPDTVAERAYGGWSAIQLEARNFRDSEQPLHFFEVEIRGRRVPALFDLGAGINMLNTTAAQALRLEALRPEQAGDFTGALGSENIVAQLGTQRLVIGSTRWGNELFLIADPAIFATLGYSE